MKEYNSFLGAFLSGDKGQGGYNAAYEKKSLANLYGGQLAPEQEQEALAGLSRVNPEAAGKWQEETVKQSAQLLLALGKDNPLAQQAWQTRIKPNLGRMFGAQAANLPDQLDDSVMAVAQQIAGVQGKDKYAGAPFVVMENNKPVYYRYGPNGVEATGLSAPDQFQMIEGKDGYYRVPTKRQGDASAVNVGPIDDGSSTSTPTTAPVGNGGVAFPGDVQGAAQRTQNIMTQVRQEIAALVAQGVPVDKATSQVTQKYAQGRGLTMPNSGQQSAPAQQTSPPVSQTAPRIGATGGQTRLESKPDAAKEPTWNNPVVEMRGGKQVRVRYNNQGGEQVMGDAEVAPPPKKAWTATGIEKYNKVRSDVQTASTINTMMDDMTSLFNDPEFELGPAQNKKYEYQNWIGNSTPQSRAYAKLSANFEKMRNDSLRLNAGVQTDGDAQRAWNEIMASMNDKELVKARLADIKRYNEFALLEKRMQLENWESEFGAPGGQRNPTPATKSGESKSSYSTLWGD